MLTREGKKELITIASILGWFLDKRNVTKCVDRNELKEPVKKVEEGLDEIFNAVKLSVEDRKRFESDFRNGVYSVDIVHCSEKMDYRRKVRKEPITLRKGDFEDLLEQTLLLCDGCTRNYKACALRKILRRMDIVSLDPEAKGCEYLIRRGEA